MQSPPVTEQYAYYEHPDQDAYYRFQWGEWRRKWKALVSSWWNTTSTLGVFGLWSGLLYYSMRMSGLYWMGLMSIGFFAMAVGLWITFFQIRKGVYRTKFKRDKAVRHVLGDEWWDMYHPDGQRRSYPWTVVKLSRSTEDFHVVSAGTTLIVIDRKSLRQNGLEARFLGKMNEAAKQAYPRPTIG